MKGVWPQRRSTSSWSHPEASLTRSLQRSGHPWIIHNPELAVYSLPEALALQTEGLAQRQTASDHQPRLFEAVAFSLYFLLPLKSEIYALLVFLIIVSVQRQAAVRTLFGEQIQPDHSNEELLATAWATTTCHVNAKRRPYAHVNKHERIDALAVIEQYPDRDDIDWQSQKANQQPRT